MVIIVVGQEKVAELTAAGALQGLRRDAAGVLPAVEAAAVRQGEVPLGGEDDALALAHVQDLGVEAAVGVAERPQVHGVEEAGGGKPRREEPLPSPLLPGSGSVSVSLGAMVFTTPLCAVYFNSLTLIAPISNLLCLWCVGLIFCGGLLAVALSFLWLPLGPILAFRQSLSLGVTQRMPPMAAKESCRLTEAAAKGFASRMRSRAAKMAVRLSRSRPKRGAKSRNESITQARSTEGEAPELAAYLKDATLFQDGILTIPVSHPAAVSAGSRYWK